MLRWLLMEIELVKQVEVNIDYIIRMVEERAGQSGAQDVMILAGVEWLIGASILCIPGVTSSSSCLRLTPSAPTAGNCRPESLKRPRGRRMTSSSSPSASSRKLLEHSPKRYSRLVMCLRKAPRFCRSCPPSCFAKNADGVNEASRH